MASFEEALCASEPDVFFSTSHFDGHPSVLVLLEKIELAELQEVVSEGWFARAPPKLAAQAEAPRRDA